VIGGLLTATVATLFFVPAVFALLHGERPIRDRRQHSDPVFNFTEQDNDHY